MKHLSIAILLLILSVRTAGAFSYDAGTNTYVCNGTQPDIQAAINDAAENHPASTFNGASTVMMTGPGSAVVTLGANGASITFGTCVILKGNGSSGPNTTTVALSTTWPGNTTTTNTNAVIEISNGAWIEGFAVPNALSGTPLFSVANGTTGARITGISYNISGSTNISYFCIISCNGTTLTQVTIDNNIIVPGGGTNELIFARGPINAWQKPDSWGSANQIYIESNQFGLPGSNTSGYVCDLNANAVGTVRYNTIYGPLKIDGHGAASNTPGRGVRQMEIYGNAFLGNYNFFQAMEIRGGTSRNFLNTASNTAVTNPATSDFITYDEYGCLQQAGSFKGVWQTPSNYPILDQVGEGEDVDGHQGPGGSDPAYMWLNQITYGHGLGTTASWQPGSKSVPGNSPGGTFQVDKGAYSPGATSINLATQSETLISSTYTDSHGTWQNAAAIASDPNRYIIASTTTNTQKVLMINPGGLLRSIEASSSPLITSNAYINWQQQTGDSTNTFNIASYVPGTPKTVILANRDIFAQTPAQWGNGVVGDFDGTQGVNFGPTAMMNGSVPSKVGVGWWVTDQGSWNNTLPPNTSGLLYVWNGSSWIRSYTPYQYPYYQPVFTIQPISISVKSGTVALSVSASNFPTYQWYLNGTTLLSGATGPILLMGDGNYVPGAYTCVATNVSGAATSAAATISMADTLNVGRLTNLSYRAQVARGGNGLIAGFAIGGQADAGEEPLLIRGSGPALQQFGVAGALLDPQIQLFTGSTLIGNNDGWGGSASIVDAAAAVGAFVWNNGESHDAALLETLAPGPYTFQVEGQSGDGGVALAEVYDTTPAGAITPASPRLVNLSARVNVGTGGDNPVVGFVVGGVTSTTVLLRASGPALAPFGIAGTLPDPQLSLLRENGDGTSTLLETNTGWAGNPEIAAEAASVGAFPWGDSATADSAVLVSLPPGNYTAQVLGANGDSGIALVEVYEVR